MQNAKGVERGIRAEYIAGLKKVQASSQVYLLDKTGGEAAALVDQLAALGVRRPTAVEGGMRRWKKDAVPFTTGLGKYESGTLRVLGDQAEAIDVDTRRAKVALGELDPKNSQVAREVASIAEELGRSSAQVALNWVLHKPGVTSALFGCPSRKPEQLHDVLAALDFTLGEDAMSRLDELSKVHLGFPQRWGGGHFLTDGGTKIVSSW